MESVLHDRNAIGLYGKLSDRFGDNGLISIVLGRKIDTVLEIELWLMSCRVLKRDMELAMLDELVARAQAAGLRTLRASYLPSKKNAMVADHYPKLGFSVDATREDGSEVYSLELADYAPRNTHIKMMELVHEQ